METLNVTNIWVWTNAISHPNFIIRERPVERLHRPEGWVLIRTNFLGEPYWEDGEGNKGMLPRINNGTNCPPFIGHSW
jgi:hypothetical protein